MHAFLICSKNKKTALEFVIEECKKNRIDKFDSSILAFEKVIGIEDIRNFQKQIVLKPIKSRIKAGILDGFNGFTIEAQNAMLKVLEEPPTNTIIYILISSKHLLLPTILSRCKVVELKDPIQISKDEFSQYLNILVSLPQLKISERLKLAQDIAKNKEATIWLEKMIMIARHQLLKSYNKKFSTLPVEWDLAPPDNSCFSTSRHLNILISLNKAYTILKTTNVNQRLAFENLFLNI